MNKNEPIKVLERRFGLVPAKFNRRGQILHVDAVEGCWTDMQQQSGAVFYHFQVRCGQKRYRLSEDGHAGTWTLQMA